MSEEKLTTLITAVVLIIIALVLFFVFTPHGRTMWNNAMYDVRKADDTTNYRTKKNVEDNCRAMIVSYTSDKLIYEQYKENINQEKQNWGEQAKMRANKTVAMYNEYVLKNSYVWNGNIPEDIKKELEYVE